MGREVGLDRLGRHGNKRRLLGDWKLNIGKNMIGETRNHLWTIVGNIGLRVRKKLKREAARKAYA